MSNQIDNGASRWSRRRIIKWGIGGGLGAIGSAYGLNYLSLQDRSQVKIPPMAEMSGDAARSGFNPVKYLRAFDRGTVSQENGRTVREFRIEAGTATVQLNSSTSFIRLYVQNMVELDSVATFHLHANLFGVFPTGRTLTPSYESDVITMGTAERHILEFSFKYPGKFMFHPHQDYMAESGCMGFFDVVAKV